MGVGVQAQSTSTSPTTPATPKTPEQALKDYQIAKEACAAQSGIARSDCLRSAKDAYERDTNGMMSNGTGGSTGNARGGAATKNNRS
jgi:hypothetical protein